MRWLLSLLLALTTAVIGCEQEAGEPFTQTSIGDTTVLFSSQPLWPDTARLELASRVGAADGPDEYIFATIRAIAVDGDGSLFVADAATSTVRKFDRDGTYVMTFGGEGSGPGELRAPDGIGVLPDGRVVVRDSRLMRINVYDAGGSAVDHWRFTGSHAYGAGTGITVDSRGTVYTLITIAGAGTAEWPARAMVGWRPSGEVADTIPFPGQRYWLDCPSPSVDAFGGSLTLPHTPSVGLAFGPTGYLVGCSDDYQADQIQKDGSVRRFRRDWTPVPIPEAERQFLTRAITAQVQARDAGWRWNGPPIPDRKSAFRSLFAGDSGRIWVRTPRPSVPRERPRNLSEDYPDVFYTEPIGFDVFAAGGRYLGPVNPPAEFQDQPAPVFREDTVWAMTVDENGVPFVGRFLLAQPTHEPAN